jgi:Flp pilus assembly protein TadG
MPFSATLSRASIIISFLRCRGGATAVEFAIIFVPLALLIFGIAEFGRAMWMLNALHYSTEEAARCVSNNTSQCGSAAQTQTFAAQSSGAGYAPAVFSVSVDPNCGNLVTASYPMQLMIPFANYSVSLQAQSCFAVQQP